MVYKKTVCFAAACALLFGIQLCRPAERVVLCQRQTGVEQKCAALCQERLDRAAHEN